MLFGLIETVGLTALQMLGSRANKRLFNLALRGGVSSLVHQGERIAGEEASQLALRALGSKKLFSALYHENKGLLKTLGARSAAGKGFSGLVGAEYKAMNPLDWAGGAIRTESGAMMGAYTTLSPLTHTSPLFRKTMASELAVQAGSRNVIRGASNMAMAFTTLGLGTAAVGWLPSMWDRVPDAQQELMAGTQYIMPRVAYTQRQRALQAIHMSQMNTYSAFGNEASYMHQ